MAKTNFTKVEEALDVGLRKIGITKLLQLADVAAGTGKNLLEKESSPPSKEAHIHQLNFLRKDLRQLHKNDPEIYSKLGFKKNDLKELIDKEGSLTPKNWEFIQQIKEKVEAYKKTLPENSNEQLVEKERVKHINKRFNINEKWLPLK